MKQKLNNSDEFRCVSRSYRAMFANSVRPGLWKLIKRQMNKRFRKDGKVNTDLDT